MIFYTKKLTSIIDYRYCRKTQPLATVPRRDATTDSSGRWAEPMRHDDVTRRNNAKGNRVNSRAPAAEHLYPHLEINILV